MSCMLEMSFLRKIFESFKATLMLFCRFDLYSLCYCNSEFPWKYFNYPRNKLCLLTIKELALKYNGSMMLK